MAGDRRFWFYVDKISSPRGCWIWTGCLGKGRYDGYGRVNRRGISKLAHRWSWELANGPIPNGKIICHRCDNPPCVNPEHLFIGTDKDNMLDMVAKGRHSKTHSCFGEKHSNAVLTEEAIRKIFALQKDGMTQRKIASIFKISQPAVSLVLNKKTWKHV